jgi:hypothetical protein
MGSRLPTGNHGARGNDKEVPSFVQARARTRVTRGHTAPRKQYTSRFTNELLHRMNRKRI